ENFAFVAPEHVDGNDRALAVRESDARSFRLRVAELRKFDPDAGIGKFRCLSQLHHGAVRLIFERPRRVGAHVRRDKKKSDAERREAKGRDASPRRPHAWITLNFFESPPTRTARRAVPTRTARKIQAGSKGEPNAHAR